METTGTKCIDWNGYKIREDGVPFNKNGSLKKWALSKKGYPITAFHIDGKLTSWPLHKLSAHLFIGPRPAGLEIDHIDNDRTNFHPNNLRYVTKSENNQKSYDSGNRVVKGIKNANCKYSEDEIRIVCKRLSEGFPISQIEEEMKVKRHTIYRIRNKEQWKEISDEYFGESTNENK